MNVYSPEQVRQWDRYTIEHEPISSADLMDRAGRRAARWLLHHIPKAAPVAVFCGPGNNGGDGFVIARHLYEAGVSVELFLLSLDRPLSPDCAHHMARWAGLSCPVKRIDSEPDLPLPAPGSWIIDALFGSGLNRPLEGLAARLVEHINNRSATVVAIDQPSGLMNQTILAVKATYTLSFQTRKLPFFFPEHDAWTGDIHVLDIGLHPGFAANTRARYATTGPEESAALVKPRPRSGHKGSFGHAALLAGSWGMIGAVALSAEACLRSGVGKLTCLTTSNTYPLLQTMVPEAIFRIEDGEDYVTQTGYMGQYQCIGFGPGCGVHPEQYGLADQLFRSGVPLVLDADALNLLTVYPELQMRIPEQTIITPHPKEFDGLSSRHMHSAARLETAMQLAQRWKTVVVLKGHHTLVASPEGRGYFNMTGNSGMATAGSGDVLTGMITGLRAQGYGATEAARLAVYWHGLAGDHAARKLGEAPLIARDIIAAMGIAWKQITGGDALRI